MKRSLSIFCAFLYRDLYAQRTYFTTYVTNYSLIYPLMCVFTYGYLQANLLFGGNTAQTTNLLAGSILLTLMVVSYKNNMKLLFDLNSDRFIDHQITILNPSLVLIERILFTGLLTFFLALPFYPLVKLILRDRFDTSATSWPLLVCMLFISALVCSAYHMLIACMFKKPSDIAHLWPRFNDPLILLGGFWVPLYVITAIAPRLSLILYLNPIMYVTEGLRQAIIGSSNFLACSTCIAALICFTVFFTTVACYFFKKRTDHI